MASFLPVENLSCSLCGASRSPPQHGGHEVLVGFASVHRSFLDASDELFLGAACQIRETVARCCIDK